ncbi:Protein Son [Labeo rohita]|uniref:Protein Son n=1 Tax=Labeo rohita TaxID=84645 RepID=A0ABQ8L2B8_LABRO|nr:Protein Son [Labeo rohita]
MAAPLSSLSSSEEDEIIVRPPPKGESQKIAETYKHCLEIAFDRVPEDAGFHSTCYRRFIDKKRLDAAEKRVFGFARKRTSQLLKAAEMKEDTSILVHIKDKDCVSLEVRYHKSCYRQYTRFLTKSTGTNTQTSEEQQDKLKRRLSRDFPQLVFHSPNKRNISELVFVETLSADKLVDRIPHPSGTETTESTEVTSQSDGESTASRIAGTTENTRTLYSAELILKRILNDSPCMTCPWPPKNCFYL